jgi:hypothetical protein
MLPLTQNSANSRGEESPAMRLGFLFGRYNSPANASSRCLEAVI